MANRSKTFSSERKLLPSQNKHVTELYTVRKVKLLKTSEKKITKINEKGKTGENEIDTYNRCEVQALLDERARGVQPELL